jgi:hypothetical protein
LFLASQGSQAEELRVRQLPDVKWITATAGTRTPPDLDDRAAGYIVQDNLVQANGDFRVFTDMVERWCKEYKHVTGARAVVEQVVREWFEQQLTETVIGLQTLRDAKHWTVDDHAKAWSEEALTAAVMPRWHIDVSVKRSLGAKLGSLKDRSA